MNNYQYEFITTLQYRVKNLQAQVDAFKNGSKYLQMVHYRNGIDETTGFDEKTVMSFEERYDSILEEAREEYEYIPPSKYYREGYNLYRRMAKYRSSHLVFFIIKTGSRIQRV